jgi:urea transport system ATP-binding protein
MSFTSNILLSLESVSKSFDGFKAINDLNFYLAQGEMRAVIGPNGAGKSTFMDIVTGRTKPDTGTVKYYPTETSEIDLTTLREHEINRLGIGRKFQTPAVYENLTVWNNLLISLDRPRGLWSTITYRITSDDRERIDEILKTVSLGEQRDTKAGFLSHGKKQWLEIGMLLAQNPKLLLVDEPAAGMSDAETERTAELLLSLKGKHSIVVIEHDMEFIRRLGQKVTVLVQGHVMREGSLEEVSEDEEVRSVYLGRKREKKTAAA